MNKITKICFLNLACLFLWAVAPAFSLQIVYPEDKTHFVRSDFLILKGGNTPPLDGVTVEVNGEKSDLIDISAPDYKAAFGDFLILEPEFDPGRNTVVVEGFSSGQKVSTARAEVYFLGADPDARPPAGFSPFRMHLPEKETLCSPCHNMNPGKADLAGETEKTNPCGSCHRRMLNKKHVHGPAGVYQCTYCHDPKSSPGKYAVDMKGGTLCTECHREKVEKFNQSKFVHGPVAALLCLTCHDPHASDFPGQLLLGINDLCLGCHEGVKGQPHVVRGVGGKAHLLEGPVDPSRPGQAFSCASCHDPHGGEASALFRNGITSQFEICQKCHQK